MSPDKRIKWYLMHIPNDSSLGPIKWVTEEKVKDLKAKGAIVMKTMNGPLVVEEE